MNCFIASISRAALTLSSVSLLGLLCSCELMDSISESAKESEKPEETAEYVISVHEIIKYPKATMLEKEIPSFGGTTVWVNTNPFLHSRNIMKVDIVEERDKPGFFDLKLTLDRRGRMMWTNLAVNFKGEKLACVIDGVFYRSFSPEQLDDDLDTEVMIQGPFDKATAMAIQKFSEKDYQIFNKK